MARPLTRVHTLYRLPSVPPTVDAMFDKLDSAHLDEINADIQVIEVGGAPGLWIAGQSRRPVATWCGHASITTGLPVSYGDLRSAGLR